MTLQSPNEEITLLTVVVTAISWLMQLLLIPSLMLNRRKHPSSMTAWLMAMISLPILGGVLYLLFGVNRVARKAHRKARASRAVSRNLPELSQYNYLPDETLSQKQRELLRTANRVSETVPTTGNRIEILSDTRQTLGLIEQAVLSAKDHLHLEYYIWQPDATGTQLRDTLIQKAREGVKVRFLYDNIGSLRLGRKFLEPMRDAGIHVARFMPGLNWYRWTINLRSHRKIVIVDGQTGFTGRMNIGDEYLGKSPELGYWRDTHLKLQGPAVLQLQQIFAEDWYYATGEELTDTQFYPSPNEMGGMTAQV
ncbi:MAG: PLDc N-terminal domain-containing protein, partial [Planctomycetaceae bacterium]|nr:PLDc N-terminal domain-containing protein [Planctomycetaceae bacterium]